MALSKRLRITEVATNMAAEQAGLQVGDIILTYDGKPMLSSGHLTEAAQAAISDNIRIEFSRRGVSRVTHVPRGRLGLQAEEFPFDAEEFQQLQAWLQEAEQYGTATLQEAFKAHIGSGIYINLKEPTKLEFGHLVKAADDHLMIGFERRLFRVPYNQILCSAEDPQTGTVRVTMNHLVVYKGATTFGAIGIAIPLDL